MSSETLYRIVVPLVYTGRGNVIFVGLKMKNRLGIMEEITDILTEARVNILQGVHSISEDGTHAYWIFTADLSQADVDLEDLIKEIKSVRGVINIDYGIEWFNEIGVPPFRIEINFMGEKVIMWRERALSLFFKAIAEEFQDAGRAFLYHIGKNAGHSLGELWLDKIRKNDYRQLIEALLDLWRLTGWMSSYTIEELHPKPFRAVIIFHGLFTCTPFRGTKDRPYGDFIRGMLSGYVERVAKVKINSIEKKCIAKGDPYCEFILEEISGEKQ